MTSFSKKSLFGKWKAEFPPPLATQKGIYKHQVDLFSYPQTNLFPVFNPIFNSMHQQCADHWTEGMIVGVRKFLETWNFFTWPCVHGSIRCPPIKFAEQNNEGKYARGDDAIIFELMLLLKPTFVESRIVRLNCLAHIYADWYKFKECCIAKIFYSIFI